MLPGFDFAGPFAPSSSAASGPATQGNQGVTIGGIQTGGSSGGVPTWVLIAAAAFALWVLRRR